MARVGSIRRIWNHKPPLAHTKLKGDKADEYSLYLALNEGAGNTVYDLSGNGNDGALVGGVNWIDSSRGRVLDFDGSSGYVNLDSIVGAPGSNVPDETFTAWIKLNNTTQRSGIVGYFRDGFWDSYGRGLKYDSGYVKVMGEQADDNAQLSFALSDTSRPYFIAGVCSASGALYVDGVLRASGDLSSSWNYMLSVGNSRGWSDIPENFNNFNGIIDNVHIYKYALSAEEIRQFYLDQYADLAPRRSVFVPRVVSGGNTNVTASVDTLVITPYKTSINAETTVAASSEAIALSTFNTSVTLDTEIFTTTASLTLSSHATSISLDRWIETTTSSITITPNAVTVSTTSDTIVEASTTPLLLTGHNAEVNASTSVEAAIDNLSITAYTVDVAADINVDIIVATLALASFDAVINATTNVNTITENISLTTHAVTVAATVPVAYIDGAISKIIATDYQSIMLYNNGTNYFTID